MSAMPMQRNRTRKFTVGEHLIWDRVIKWMVARMAGISPEDITHTYIVTSRVIPGESNKVMMSGVPCEHMTDILRQAVSKGEAARAAEHIPPCPYAGRIDDPS